MKHWVHALRPHQWAKNLLVFVAVFTAHKFSSTEALADAAIAAACFCLAASSAYLVNDILDVKHDRLHPVKKNRPFAAGHLSAPGGLFASAALAAISVSAAYALLPHPFLIALVAYVALTLSYSIWLKKIAMVDVIVLAILYTLRIAAGAFAIGVPVSSWILALSLFFFLSLALTKRYAEVDQLPAGASSIPGRGYAGGDKAMLLALGVSSGMLATFAVALYANDPHTQTLYSKPQTILFACPLLLYWIGRIWLLTERGKMKGDPFLYGITDISSIVTSVLIGMIFVIAM